MSASLVTSVLWKTALPPFSRQSRTADSPPSWLRSAITTAAPSPAKRIAVARPMPLAAPVITATLPLSLPIIVNLRPAAPRRGRELVTLLAPWRQRYGRAYSPGNAIILMLMGGRLPTNRNQAAAMARSAEGMHPRVDTSSDPTAGESSTEISAPTAPTEAEAGANEISVSREKPNPGNADTGPRFDSLVAYPDTPPSDAPQDVAADDDGAASAEDELTRKLDGIPTDPGVYLLKDRNGKVLYVGKAKSLRSRVRAYFR